MLNDDLDHAGRTIAAGRGVGLADEARCGYQRGRGDRLTSISVEVDSFGFSSE